ncbi:MAG: thiamine phosphate synthase [Dehalococcoidia bacterium]
MAVPPRLLRWPSPCLMLVTDEARLRGRDIKAVVSLAVSGGVNAVQLREKDLPATGLYHTAVALHSILRGRALLLVNDRLDVALACGADGVHLPEDGLPGKPARALAGENCLVGRSVHSVDAARRAEEDGLDYVILGTVFETVSKLGQLPAGVSLVRGVADAIRLPVIAIGGIRPGNVREVIEAGADGVAVIGAILDADDPQRAAEDLRRALDDAYGVTAR